MTTSEQTSGFAEFKSGLKSNLGSDVYRSFFVDLELSKWDDKGVILTTKNDYAAYLITNRYAQRVHESWEKVFGTVPNLSVTGVNAQQAPQGRDQNYDKSHSQIGNQLSRPAQAYLPAAKNEIASLRQEPAARNVKAYTEQNATANELAQIQKRVRTGAGRGMLQQTKTLDCFCVNETNRMARHAATRMLDGLGSPITYVYGSSGRGKSHLLNAAALEWLRRHPNGRLMYLQYDALIADVSDACMSNRVKELKEHLQDTDFLVFDDVHLLRGRKRTQEELVCLFDCLLQLGKQALVAGALSPAELAETGILARLADRLAGGISVELQSPDFELRLRVANQWGEQSEARTGLIVPQRQLDLIARQCDASIRTLEGVLSHLDLEMYAANEMLSDAQVLAMIRKKLVTKTEDVTLENLFNYVAEVFGVSKAEMRGKRRLQPIVRSRQAFCLAARRLTSEPLVAIAAMICKDHTTVMHSIEKADIIAESDEVFGDRISTIFDHFGK